MQRGLAGAVGAEQRVDLAGRDLEAHPAQRLAPSRSCDGGRRPRWPDPARGEATAAARSRSMETTCISASVSPARGTPVSRSSRSAPPRPEEAPPAGQRSRLSRPRARLQSRPWASDMRPLAPVARSGSSGRRTSAPPRGRSWRCRRTRRSLAAPRAPGRAAWLRPRGCRPRPARACSPSRGAGRRPVSRRALVLQRWEAEHGGPADVVDRGQGRRRRLPRARVAGDDAGRASRRLRGHPPPARADLLTMPAPLSPLELAAGLPLPGRVPLPALPSLPPGTTPRAALETRDPARAAPRPRASSASPAAATPRPCWPPRRPSPTARACRLPCRSPTASRRRRAPTRPPGRSRSSPTWGSTTGSGSSSRASSTRSARSRRR